MLNITCPHVQTANSSGRRDRRTGGTAEEHREHNTSVCHDYFTPLRLSDCECYLIATAEKRKKQFALLFDCIDDLQRALRADEEEQEARTEGTGKRKRLTTEEEEDAKGKSIDESETARKRVREVEMEDVSNEDPNKDMEPGEITKGREYLLFFTIYIEHVVDGDNAVAGQPDTAMSS